MPGIAVSMRHSASLDALRGLAALSIVVLHAWLYTTTAAEKSDSLLDGVVHQLRLGVPLFFCLSGFLLYRRWVLAVEGEGPTPRLADYARRRFWRVVPAYALALAGTLALLLPLTAVRGVDVPPGEHLWLFAVFASNLHRETVGALDPPMWTLAVEVQFYALLPLVAGLAAARARRRPAWLLLAPLWLIVGGTAFNLALAQGSGDLVAASSLAALAPCFGAGMGAAVLASRPGLQAPRATAALLLAALVLVLADGAWHEQDAGALGRVLRDLPAAIGFAALILVLAGRGRTWLAARPLALLGDLSFPIYLWHMPLMLALRGAGLFPEGRPLAALPAVLAVTLPVAWLSWTRVERPVLRWSARPRPRRYVGIEPAKRPRSSPSSA